MYMHTLHTLDQEYHLDITIKLIHSERLGKFAFDNK